MREKISENENLNILLKNELNEAKMKLRENDEKIEILG